ncbi:restriction endonuclease [Trichocoleus sp. FACHB-90]|uniref:restriction endonuclease n=1 Tax=Cyanophyceae TaxID=3028117 RepID=UPI0016888466|nr:restriction endonuclease [Trichocoleus sp. FACHB-90]MBD1926184.1 restriction endonuclease [Trichocoleus sp. FACHB-90]
MKVAQIVREVASTLADASVDRDVVNLQRFLRDRLQQEGFSALKSTEFAEDWLQRLHQELEEQLTEWDLLGIPRPLVQASSPSTFITFRHRNYHSAVGIQGIPIDFPSVYDFVASLAPREFLLVPACLLQLAGCDPIIITDGSGDGGVDCIGQITAGSMRSICIFIQARTSSTNITKESVQLEYAKFRDLQRTGQFIEYLAALGKGNSADGRAACYAMIGSAEFQAAAREYASREGVLLRSRRQIAFWLCKSFSLDSLIQLREKVGATLVRDLSRNIAPLIASYRCDDTAECDRYN